MFSPYYAWSGWREPDNHCAMNVALYRPGRNRWAMTERGRLSLAREASCITIGPSCMRWTGNELTVDINEWTAPLPSRVRGRISLTPQAMAGQAFELDAEGRHIWRPIAPRARVSVEIVGDASWSGEAYFDSNWGEEPLERCFRAWDWSRAHAPDATIVYYDVVPRNGPARSLALSFDRSGAVRPIAAPPVSSLPTSFWRMQPRTRGEGNSTPRLVRYLEDAPFYTRSQLAGRIDGAEADIMHESLSLDRFSNPVVRAMLPFRMPRFVRRG